MGIKKGYKQIEIGVIPEDWECASLGGLFKFKNGLNKGKEFFGYGTPIINYSDVYQKPEIRVEDILGKVYLSPKEIKLFEVQKGDVFFTRTSETPEEVGISSVVIEDVNNTVFSGFVLRARSLNEKLDLDYKKYCFSTQYIRNEIVSKCTFTTRALTNGKLLSKIQIPIPPLPEQQAIASALSDIDGLINLLVKLIDKKKNIKLGAMQELLTGKKRLEGFTGKWMEKNIGDLLNYEQPWKYVTSQLLPYNSSSIPVLTANKAFILGSTSETHNCYTNLPVIIFDDFTTDTKYVNFKFKIRSSAIKILTPRNDVSLKFISNLIQITPFTIIDHKRYYISEYQNITVKVPNYKEQTAIATTLSDMDSEIEALEQKLNKYKNIKQGMMQELLTGRIRLIEGAV